MPHSFGVPARIEKYEPATDTLLTAKLIPTRHLFSPPSSPEEQRRANHKEKTIQWKLHPIDLPPLLRTRPPLATLNIWDVRARRELSPTASGTFPDLLSPLPPSPKRYSEKAAQTIPPARIHRATQNKSSRKKTRATQVLQLDTNNENTQTEGHSADATTQLPPILKWTVTQPSISYRPRF